jgi:hypothetical protein
LWADPYLKETADIFFNAKSSISQKIQHSDTYRERFAANVQRMEGGTSGSRLTNLRAVKHRMESLQKPMGRSVLYFQALMLTNEQIANERKEASDGKSAEEFDRSMTSERALMLSMMADCSDENMRLVRFCDEGEECHIEELADEAEHFLEKCSALFVDGACFQAGGYTSYMCSLLDEGIMTFIKNTPHQIGGCGRDRVTDDVKARCLSRMQNWLQLAKLAVRAEFPEQSILHAMSVFKLSAPKAVRRALDMATMDAHLTRIAQLLTLNPSALKAQFHDHRPRAARLFAQSGEISSAEAWRQAVKQTQQSQARKNHPSDVLVLALARFLGWGWSTSSAERTFAVSSWAWGLAVAEAKRHGNERWAHRLAMMALALAAVASMHQQSDQQCNPDHFRLVV